MIPEQKKKLRNIAALALLALIGGTFAFQSFNQRATNDREGWNNEGAAGRIHDYYSDETGNKDVFVENYGDEPLLVRVQLKEFLSKNDESIVRDAERGYVDTWTVWQPAADDIHNRLDSSPSQAFDRYADWSFGFSRRGGIADEMASRNQAQRDRMGVPICPPLTMTAAMSGLPLLVMHATMSMVVRHIPETGQRVTGYTSNSYDMATFSKTLTLLKLKKMKQTVHRFSLAAPSSKQLNIL